MSLRFDIHVPKSYTVSFKEFEKAKEYEKTTTPSGNPYTWNRKETLDELTYDKLMEGDAAIMDSSVAIMQKIPLSIYVG